LTDGALLGMVLLAKSVVDVDDQLNVNVRDCADGFFRVRANVDPKPDILLTERPSTTSITPGEDVVLSMLVVGLVFVGVVVIGDLLNWRARKRHRA
jgi:hypothetical protein